MRIQVPRAVVAQRCYDPYTSACENDNSGTSPSARSVPAMLLAARAARCKSLSDQRRDFDRFMLKRAKD
jgi:hypothetical protein